MSRLRSAGGTAWSIFGIVLVVATGLIVFVLLRPMVISLLAALFVAVALSPAVEALVRRRMRRGAAAGLGTLLLIVVGLGVTVLIVKGLAEQWPQISAELGKAVDKLDASLNAAGVPGSPAAAAQRSIQANGAKLLSGLLPALGGLLGTTVDLAIGVFLVLFTTYYLLKDGPAMVLAAGPAVPLPRDLGPQWLAQVGRVIRGYIVGLTLLGVFNAFIVGLGALLLGLPLIFTIVIVTLLGNYIPYLGAWVAGAYAVLIAFASGGASTALIMIVVVVIANGTLQTLLQPFAYGAALNMSPLITLLVTIAGGLLAGVLGVMLAAPVAAIVQHTYRLLRPT
jgi:predicted PurR-regulated permease PerM